MTIKDISNNDAIKCLHVMRTRTTGKKKKNLEIMVVAKNS